MLSGMYRYCTVPISGVTVCYLGCLGGGRYSTVEGTGTVEVRSVIMCGGSMCRWGVCVCERDREVDCSLYCRNSYNAASKSFLALDITVPYEVFIQ